MLKNHSGTVDPVTIIWAAGLLLAMLAGAYRYVAKNPPPQPTEGQLQEQTTIGSGPQPGK